MNASKLKGMARTANRAMADDSMASSASAPSRSPPLLYPDENSMNMAVGKENAAPESMRRGWLPGLKWTRRMPSSEARSPPARG